MPSSRAPRRSVPGNVDCQALEPRRLLAAVPLAVDTTFGQGGRTVADLATYDGVGDAERLDDGKVVLVGQAATGNTWQSMGDGYVARFNPNGTRDAGFGAAGVSRLPAAVTGEKFDLTSVVPQPGGKLLV